MFVLPFPPSFSFQIFFFAFLIISCAHHQGTHNSEMELQSLQEKTVSDMTAKNKELMELEAHITTLEEESAKNLKRFCDERASDQQRFRDLQHYANHVMSHDHV
ncbi:hypothetical protein Pelo_19614 [Pelomyxa schiedti]|nr:hypothetical protein Pelo_19614 [Pelomyxa schiedti]